MCKEVGTVNPSRNFCVLNYPVHFFCCYKVVVCQALTCIHKSD